MKIARMGKEYCIINEENLHSYTKIPKIHLIKLDFKEPTLDIVEELLSLYSNTNRFIINNNIRLYNYILRNTKKKYYIENVDDNIITFFRKNNKCMLNFMNLNHTLRNHLLENLLQDILKNVEVVLLSKDLLDNYNNILRDWTGNVILYE